MNGEAEDFGIPFGYVPERNTFPTYPNNMHLITFGPTRSGKGSTVIVQTLLLVPHSIICVDPKGQNAAITARRRRELGQDVYFLNPFDELGLGTAHFNPLAHLSIDGRNVVADVAALAEALIISEGTQPHFPNSARALVAALILHLIETRPGTATLLDMRQLLTQIGDEFTATIREMVASSYPFISQPAGRFASTTDEISSVLSTAITQTAFLDDPAIIDVLSSNDFRMTDLKDKPTTIYLILPGRYMEAYARFFRLLVTSAIDQLTSRPGGHRTLIILDEFASLQNLAAVSKAFGFAAGYNVQVWPFLQDLPQLKAIYGEKWESFLANAGLVQFFTPSDLTTAEYIQRRGGLTLLSKETKSFSSGTSPGGGSSGSSTSYSDERIPLLPTEVTMGLPARRQLVFYAGVNSVNALWRRDYFHIPRLRGMYDPDPFHIPTTPAAAPAPAPAPAAAAAEVEKSEPDAPAAEFKWRWARRLKWRYDDVHDWTWNNLWWPTRVFSGRLRYRYYPRLRRALGRPRPHK